MTELKGVVHVLRDRTSTPPSLLYRYSAFTNWTHRVFQNNELYFQSPNDFNDPSDSAYRFTCEGSRQQRKRFFREHSRRYDPNLPRSRALSLEKQFKNKHLDGAVLNTMTNQLRKIRGQIGVCCLTEKKDNILMWSHYGELHTGLCLEFRTDDPFFSDVHPVRYSHNLPCVNVLAPWDELIGSSANAFLTKAEEWKYEREWRIIDPTRGPGVRQFPARVLNGVILGCRISTENSHRITEWCKARAPRPRLYRARKKQTEYGLDIEPVEY